MENPDLVSVCLSAFIGVFIVLTILAAILRLIIVLFPAKVIDDSSAIVAAITSTYSIKYPGTKISNIQEEK